MDQQFRFVGLDLAGELSMTELCELFSISRKTGYQWRERYAASGAERPVGLSYRSLHARFMTVKPKPISRHPRQS